MNSQGLWLLRELIRLGEFELIVNTRLKEDLTAYRYSISGDKVIKVESKDQLKKWIGRSPDHGDSVMMSVMPLHLGSRVVSRPTLV